MGEAYNWVVSICLKVRKFKSRHPSNCRPSSRLKPAMMAIPLVLMAFLVASLTTGAESIALTLRNQCPGGKPFITSLEVSSNGIDCPVFPCALYKGEYTLLTVTVQTDKAMDASMVPTVYGTIGGVPLPWAVPAAPGYPKVVPIAGGYSYSMKFPVSGSYPSIRCAVKWSVKDSNGDDIYCFRMPVQLRTP